MGDRRRKALEWINGFPDPEATALEIERRASIRALASFRKLPLDQLRGLALCDSSARISGVYFLWNGPQLLYIGKASSVRQRVKRHAYEGRQFTCATYFPVPIDCARTFERAYISKYPTPWNVAP